MKYCESHERVLLAESEVVQYNLISRIEIEVLVKSGSVLYPQDVSTSKWTTDGSHLTLNWILSGDETKVFSIFSKDEKFID